MRKDPIVEEVQRAREAYASRFDFDVEALVEDLKRQQAEPNRQVVTRKPRKPEMVDPAPRKNQLRFGSRYSLLY